MDHINCWTSGCGYIAITRTSVLLHRLSIVNAGVDLAFVWSISSRRWTFPVDWPIDFDRLKWCQSSIKKSSSKDQRWLYTYSIITSCSSTFPDKWTNGLSCATIETPFSIKPIIQQHKLSIPITKGSIKDTKSNQTGKFIDQEQSMTDGFQSLRQFLINDTKHLLLVNCLLVTAVNEQDIEKVRTSLIKIQIGEKHVSGTLIALNCVPVTTDRCNMQVL